MRPLASRAQAPCAAGSYYDAGTSTCVDCGAGAYATGVAATCAWTNVPTTCDGSDGSAWTTAIASAAIGVDGSRVAVRCATPDGGVSFTNGARVTCDAPYVAVTLTFACDASVTPDGALGLTCDTSNAPIAVRTGCGSPTSGEGLSKAGSAVTCAFDGGQSACSKCPQGTECAAARTSVPVPCDEGEYNDVAGESCKDCPAGSTCANIRTVDPKTCEAGRAAAARSTECVDCPAGNYSASAGSATCDACPAGYICEDALTTVPEACAAGSYALEGSTKCVPCAVGTYQNSSASASCDPCPPGRLCYSNAQRVTPGTCPAGSYAPEGHREQLCNPCAIGTYQPLTGQGECKACDVGKSCPEEGLTAPRECAGGTYSGYDIKDEAVAFALPYNASDTNRHPTVSAEGGSSCETCPAGYYCPDGLGPPTLCPIGTYSVAGATSCVGCDAGKACPKPLVSSIRDCISGTFSVGNATSCTECSPGRYCMDTTKNLQLNCALGFYSYGGAVSACTRCEAGKECPDVTGSRNADCDPGTFSAGGQTTCTFCPPGRFCNETDSAAAQYDCAAGTYSGGKQITCTPCAAGTFGVIIAAVTPSDCNPCPSGMYSTVEGASSDDACQLCPVDTECPNTGTVTPTPCASGLGTFGEVGQTACGTAPPAPSPPPSPPPPPPSPPPPAPPPLNETVSAPKISLRLQGNIEEWTSANESAFQIGIAAALNDGTVAADVEVISVKSGSVIVDFQITSAAMFPPTYGGDWNQTYLTDAVAKISSAVTTNTLNVGAPVYDLPSVDCAPGSYVFSSSGSNRVCKLCSRGEYSSVTNAPQCTSCAGGTATPYQGSSACANCAPGTVAPNPGSSECSLCPRGTIQPASGEMSCTQCQDNYFASAFGSISCAPCPAGFVSGAPAWVGETAGMRADGALSVEVQEAIGGVRCIPDGTYDLPPPPPPSVKERLADRTSWIVGGISLSVYTLFLYVLGRYIWRKEKLTLKYAENESFMYTITPLMENTPSRRGTMREFEEEDLRFAIDCFRRGAVDDAEGVCSRIAERNHLSADALQGLGIARACAGDLEYAHAFAHRSVNIASTSQRQITLANIYLSQGHTEKAIALFDIAIRRDPVSAIGHFNIGNAHFMSGDWANARASYLAALDREPHYYKALYNLAMLLDVTGFIAEAKDTMKRAVEIRRSDVRGVYAMGLLYVKLGQWKKAEEQFKNALLIDDKHAMSHVKLGNLAFRRGEFEFAGALYLNALESDSTNVEALTNIAMLDWCKGLSNASNSQLRLAITINPTYYPALYNLAVTRLSQGRVDECLRYYQRAKACSGESALEKTQIFNLSVALADIDEIDDEEVPMEFTTTAAEHQLMKIAVSKIQTDDGRSSMPATSVKTSVKSTPTLSAMPSNVAHADEGDGLLTRTECKYVSLVFISDAVKFPERLESCALDDTCVIVYEHDMNRVMLCRTLVSKAKEKLSDARGLQSVDRIAIIAPAFLGGVQLGEHVVIDSRTVRQHEDVSFFLKGLNEMLGLYQWQGKRLDFLTLDHTAQVNIQLLRTIKFEHSFECDVACSDTMESVETFTLTDEQLKLTHGAASGTSASLNYFNAKALKDWASLPRAPPKHKIVQSSTGGMLALKGDDEYEKAKVSWRTAAKATMALRPAAHAVMPMHKASIEPPPPILAPPEPKEVPLRRSGKRHKQSKKSQDKWVDLEMMTPMPSAKFKQHVTQVFFCNEIAVELGIDANRVRVVRTDEITDTVTVRITEKRTPENEPRMVPSLETIVKNFQDKIKDGTFIIDDAFNGMYILGVFWPPTETEADVDDAASGVSSGDDTRVSHDENTPTSFTHSFASASITSEFNVHDIGGGFGAGDSKRANPSSTVTQPVTTLSLEPTPTSLVPIMARQMHDFMEIEFNDASESVTSAATNVSTPRWDLDRNVENLRKLERTGIWDADI